MDVGIDTASSSRSPHHQHTTTTTTTSTAAAATATSPSPTEEDGEDPLLPGRSSRPVTSGVDQNQNQWGLAVSASSASATSSSDSPKKTRFAMDQGSKGSAGQQPSAQVNGESPEQTPPSDEELLKRLEEANRLLEADEKSRAVLSALSSGTTPGHSRKGSGSSIVSSTSSNSFYSTQNSAENDDANGQSETLWEIWGRIINDFDTVKKRPAFLKELVRKGIPHEFRGMAWQLVLGVHDSPWKLEYREHMKKTSPCEKLIRRDIARTFPEHDFFKEKDGFGQESLFNVMKAYSLHDREVGYCQGSGFIVGLLLMQMPEEDAFAVMVRLMQDFRLRELFKPSMAELGLCMYKLECLIQELLPTLLVHFQTQNFDTSMYASSWFLTLFVTSLPLSLARRIMDLFVSEGMEMIFRVGVAILQMCQEDLLALDMEGLLKYLQKDLRSRFDQDSDQDNLLTTAYSIKYNHKKMKKLEKEYTALKTKENEDQIELRRLRTENRLLRQRIENLEKVEARLLRQNEESATLADKLVQDQVTWAQEVEQTYGLRNELSVTRQQMAEMQKKLVDAEDIIGDIRKRTRLIKETVHLDEAEEANMVKHLQEELIAVRLREAETAETIRELRLKISDLEDTNLRLQRAPSNDVQQLQEELIAVKLREAEANLSLKELRMKVNEIESYWEAHMERVRQNSPKEKSGKAELRHLQEEVMGLKLKEARAVADLKDAKQKLMELETQNQICCNQIRRMGEENKDLKAQLEGAAARERELRANIKDLVHKLDDLESKRREELMMSRIRDAECTQQLAELRHRVADIDIQREELLTAGRLSDKGGNQDLENKLCDLQDEVLQLQMSVSPKPGTPRRSAQAGNGANNSTTSGKPHPHNVMTYSFMGDNSDEEVDAEIKDSENLNKTLTDIIEGRSPKHQNHSANNNNDSSKTSNGDRDGENLLRSPAWDSSTMGRNPQTEQEPHKDSAVFSPTSSSARRLEDPRDDSVDFISDIETNPLFDPDPDDVSEACSAVSLAASDVSPSVKSVNSCVLSQPGALSDRSSHGHSRGASDSGFSCSDDGYTATKDSHHSLTQTTSVASSAGLSSLIHSLDAEQERGECGGSGKTSVIEGLVGLTGLASNGGNASSTFVGPDGVKDDL